MEGAEPLDHETILAGLRRLRAEAPWPSAGRGANWGAELDRIVHGVERLGEETERVRGVEGQLFAEVTAILSSTHLVEVLQLIVDAAVRLAGAERGFVVFRDEAGRLEFAAARDMDRTSVRGPEGEVSRNIVSRVFDTGEIVRLADARAGTAFAEAESVTRLRLRSVLALPLRMEDKVLGVLYLENRRVSGLFTGEKCALMERFSGRLGAALRNAWTVGDLRRARDELQSALGQQHKFPGVVGYSPAFRRVLAALTTAAKSDLPIVIEGESGTGKELLGRAVHAASDRAGGPWVAANCAALPGPLLESELFGHVRGAFTGAERERKGLFATAHGGTLFLDEVGEMPLELQSKLLRVLQSGELRPLGSDRVAHVNVRVVAATQKNLEAEVESGRFRADVLYRLKGLLVRVPPLRERREDVLLMAEHFLCNALPGPEGAPVFSAEARMALLAYDYPGNVRELENAVRRAAVFAKGGQITLECLPPELRGGTGAAVGTGTAPRNAEELARAKADARRAAGGRVESLFLMEALREARGNVSLAAKRTGMNRSQFQQMLKRHGLSGRDFRKA